jgi:hypothetical protein
MTTDTSRERETVECISEAHLQFIRAFIMHEEKVAKATLERFLRERERFKRAASEGDHGNAP